MLHDYYKPHLTRQQQEILTQQEEEIIGPLWRSYELLQMVNTKRMGTYTFYGLPAKKQAELSYRDDMWDGVFALYLDVGRLVSSVRYQSDNLIDSSAAVQWPLRSQRKQQALLPPGFPSGDSAFTHFLRTNYESTATLQYGELLHWYAGTHQVCIIIAEDGSVHNVGPLAAT